MQPLISGRLKRKKAACITYLPCRTLNPNSRPVLSPRGRELERGQQAARLVLGRLELGCWGRLPQFWEMPSPQPSPTEEGASCSRFRRYRPSEKECPKYQRQEFFRQPLSQGRWNKRCERFFRRPLNPSAGCVPQGTHAVDWGGRKNRERVRTAHTLHAGYGLLNPNSRPASLPWERARERATSRKACIWAVMELGEGCHNSENALSPTLPHGGGGGLQQVLRLQAI